MSDTETNAVQEMKKTVHEIKSAMHPMADQISMLSEVQRRYFLRIALPVYFVLLCLIGIFVDGYFRLSSRHVTFVTEADTKTLIGLQSAGRIQADTDERTGETIIEVYHAKK